MALGEILRDARSRKGWSTAQVAEATRMMVQIVEELEHEDFRRIAAPIYGRGFIKLYAEHVGLDPEPLIQEFIEIYTGARAPIVTRRVVNVAAPTEPAAPVIPMPTSAAPVETKSLAEAQVATVVPIDNPMQAADDDLFTTSNRQQPPKPMPVVTDVTPPRVSPVGVRAIRRPQPIKPAIPANSTTTAATPVNRTPGTTAAVIAGLQRLWGDFGLPVGWFTRRRVLLLAAGLAMMLLLIYGIRTLVKVTTSGAIQDRKPISEQVLPPPDTYVD